MTNDSADTAVLESVKAEFKEAKHSDIEARLKLSDLGKSVDLGDLADVHVERCVDDSYHLENFMYVSDGRWEKSDVGVRIPLTDKDIKEIKNGKYVLIGPMRNWRNGGEYALCKKYK